MPGPVPNRSDDLARPRERKGGNQIPITKGTARPFTVPEPDPEWHPIALMLWDSLTKSGQQDFYQQSDWAFAWSICEDLSHYKNSKQRSAMMLSTIYSAMTSLLVTEGDRRRIRIELSEEPVEDDSEGIVITDLKARLKVV